MVQAIWKERWACDGEQAKWQINDAKSRPIGFWSNGKNLALIILNVSVRASIRALWKLVSVLPQLSINWVETVSPLRNVSGAGTPRILKRV